MFLYIIHVVFGFCVKSGFVYIKKKISNFSFAHGNFFGTLKIFMVRYFQKCCEI